MIASHSIRQNAQYRYNRKHQPGYLAGLTDVRWGKVQRNPIILSVTKFSVGQMDADAPLFLTASRSGRIVPLSLGLELTTP